MLFKNVNVDGLNIFYREAGNEAAPRLVLLHGFPASSHQYRNLIPALADRFHVIAPDYPGFGNSDMPDPATFAYTFDKTSEMIEEFLGKVGFTPFGLYAQDYGGPVGFRIVTRRPDWLEWLSSRTPTPTKSASPLRGTVCAAPIGKAGRLRTRSRLKPFCRPTRSSSSTPTAIADQNLSARTTGTWICTTSIGRMLGGSSSTSSTTTGQTYSSTRIGRRSSESSSPTRLFSGDRTTSSSHAKAVSLISRISPMRRCIG